MRIEIKSTDRVGISQELLSQVSKLGLNIRAMEVATGVMYLHLDARELTFDDINLAISKVVGVTDCKLIELLPTESREQHLKTLLKRIPAPIFDIDATGKILSCNANPHIYENKHIEKVLNLVFETIKVASFFAIEVVFEDKTYHAEISPIWSEGNFNGAVITLNSLNRIGQQLALLQSGTEASSMEDIIGQTKSILLLKQQLVKFAKLDLPVLISGETGTGKELVARAIHQQSARTEKPFLAINCASLSEQLLESELFGYVSGAFTGASTQGKPGLFELAQGGTVFLDEVAEMSVYLQAKLLRFLQDYSYRRLGGSKELTANVRIISASHQPFEMLIKDSRFREDLYYRLNVLNITLPPLRERFEDIPLLCHYFIVKAAKQVNMSIPEITSAALNKLSGYAWPGNVRQLQNVLFRLVALHGEDTLDEFSVESVLEDFGALDNITENQSTHNWLNAKNWQQAQDNFEYEVLKQFYPLFPSTRKLAERLQVSHNKIAMKLRKHKFNENS